MTEQFLDTSPSTTKIKLLHRFVDIRVLAMLVSIILSAWAVFLDDVVNNDGTLYLHIAELLDRGEWQAAFQLYKWPFYPFLISLVAKVPGLDYEYAAHLLNAALTALAVVCFISLVRELGGNKATVLAAAILVLLYPGINEYRSFIIRDTGYIGFYLLSLLFFFKSLKSQGWGYVASWVSSILIATLFRIEGFVFVAMLPLLFYIEKHAGQRMRVSGFIALIGIACGLTVVLAWWLGGGITAPDPKTIGPETIGLLQSLWESTTTAMFTKITLLGETLLSEHASDHAPTVFFVSLLVILLAEILRRLTLVNAALVGHALYHRLIFPMTRAKTIWIWLVLVNLMILMIFVFATQFLTGRFPLALSLTLMLAVPFSLVVLHGAWRDQRTKRQTKNWLFPAVCVLILLFGLDGLYSPTNKTYLKEAGVWLKENTPAKSSLFGNNLIVMYYSGRKVSRYEAVYEWQRTRELIRSGRWLNYDYLAFRIKREDSKRSVLLAQMLRKDSIKTVRNKKGGQVVIFQVR